MKANKKSRVIEKNYKKAREIKKLNVQHDYLIQEISKIIHPIIKEVYAQDDFNGNTGEKMKKAVSLCLGTVSRKLGIKPTILVEGLLLEQLQYLYRVRENKLQNNDVLR